MLVALLNVPRSDDDWNRWAFAHKESHLAISQAILSAGGKVSAEYQLDPIPPNDLQGWLTRNQQAHNDMNQTLGLQSADIETTDLTDRRQLEAWIYLHFLEHQTAEQALKI
jgi:hypothetical protein